MVKRLKALLQALGWCLCPLIVLLLGGCINAAVTSSQMVYDRYNLTNTYENYKITANAYDIIHADPKLAYDSNITVGSFKHTILIAGQTPNEQLHQKAVKELSHIDGVKKVVDQVHVEKPIGAKIQLYDTWLTTKITSKIIASGRMDPDNIKVITDNYTVYLLGQLTRPQAQLAVEIARNTVGVKKVVNALEYLIITQSTSHSA